MAANLIKTNQSINQAFISGNKVHRSVEKNKIVGLF